MTRHTIATTTPPDLTRALERVRAEFIEMPGLHLTLAQATRLWNLDSGVCLTLLQALVDARFLTRTPRATFCRT